MKYRILFIPGILILWLLALPHHAEATAMVPSESGLKQQERAGKPKKIGFWKKVKLLGKIRKAHRKAKKMRKAQGEDPSKDQQRFKLGLALLLSGLGTLLLSWLVIILSSGAYVTIHILMIILGATGMLIGASIALIGLALMLISWL